jgi:gliding motility-associated protein GldL
MNALAHFFETSKGKRVKNMIIGLGAAVVLMGALFKLMSWPGAGGMLTAGLITEAFIFALQGILPPHKDYYWEKIYPELDISPEEEADMAKSKSVGGKKSVTEELDSMLEKAKVESSLIQRLGTNLEKFSANLERMTEVANVAGSTNEYATKAKEASAALDQMKAAYANATNAVNSLASTTAEFKGYQDQIQLVSKNLASLNSLYENELNGVTGNLKSLNKNLTSLNTVYGNMLSAMGVKG